MLDVSALSGASLKTVSRVVNGAQGVTPALAEKVRTAIAQLGYRHNQGASSLRSRGQRTSSIGVLLHDVANPFSSAMYRAIEFAARDRGVVTLAGSLDGDPERERHLVMELVERRVDGVILMPSSGDHSYLLDERRTGTQFVFVDRPPAFFDADSVLADNRVGAARATQHLVDVGHRRIAYLGDSVDIVTARERLDGFTAAMSEARLVPDPQLVVTDVGDPDRASVAMERLLDLADPPSAVLTAQNLVTFGVLHTLRDRRLRHIIAHVGFDDLPLADLLEPGLTVIAQDPTRIGRTAADLLFARIDGDASPTRHVVSDVRLIVRGSGELPGPFAS